MILFLAIVLGHWTEHVVQIFQIYVLHMPRMKAMGLLGLYLPSLTSMELFHFGYALAMLIGLLALRDHYRGRALKWWDITTVLQTLHLFEHTCLVYQSLTGHYWFGQSMPCSLGQQFFPGNRAELHFFYNTVVTIPMVYSMWVWRQEREMARAYIRSMDRKLAELIGILSPVNDTRFLEVYE